MRCKRNSLWLEAIVLVCCSVSADAAVEGFVETFDGNGNYVSIGHELEGLDNPEWYIVGDGELSGGAYVIENQAPFIFETVRDRLFRPVFGRGSFTERIEIKAPYLGDYDRIGLPPGIVGKILFEHRFDNRNNEEDNAVLVDVYNRPSLADGVWGLTIIVKGPEEFYFTTVPQGPHIALELIFDDDTSEVTVGYDNDINDESPSLTFGPFAYDGTYQLVHQSLLQMGAIEGGVADGLLDNWSLTRLSNLPGDFDRNGILTVADIDLLSVEVRAGTNSLEYDLNGDTLVDQEDRKRWVNELKSTYFGDADLNGEFTSSDMINVFLAGEYEDAIADNSAWADGDWNGDGDFTSMDIVFAFLDGGYELGPRPSAAVPEPSALLLNALSAVAVLPFWLATSRHKCV